MHCTFSQAHHKHIECLCAIAQIQNSWTHTQCLSDYYIASYANVYVCECSFVWIRQCMCVSRCYGCVRVYNCVNSVLGMMLLPKLWILFWCIWDLRYNECGSFLIFARKSFALCEHQKVNDIFKCSSFFFSITVLIFALVLWC